MRVLIVTFCIVPIIAFGRIGETSEQCIHRYGPVAAIGPGDCIYQKHSIKDYEIIVVFLNTNKNATAEGISYVKSGKFVNAALDKDEVEKFLSVNMTTSKWQYVETMVIAFSKTGIEKEEMLADAQKYLRWQTLDLCLFARYDRVNHDLIICTDKFLKTDELLNKKKLSGF